MAIELIPKAPKRPLPWERAMTVASFAFLGFIIVLLIVLGWAQNSAKAEIANLQKELTREKTSEEQNLENEVLAAQKYLTAFTVFVAARQPFSPVISLIETRTHPQVFFTKLDYSAKDNRLTLAGKTDNFQVLGQQHIIFEKTPGIKTATLMQAGIGKTGFVEFSFDLILDPAVFKNQ